MSSSQTGPWPPLVSPHSTLSIAMYMSMYYILTYFAGSFGRYNIHAKVFCWLMAVYPIVTALPGFQFTNLLLYIIQVVPTVTGYYSIDKFFGKNKENLICWLDHTATKLCASRIPHEKWVQEASKRRTRLQLTGLPPGLAHKLMTSLTTGKSSKRTSPTIFASTNPSKT
ncbi:hypothetical protein DSO57_1015369 [Entomophthora muscae]|uniref:Uncharacterized protein n=1 Tax=Entomophthora muscae TaxID=34485 RepID=A0ACC2S6Z0_9FUNG|nr:hypothetical protein DSO57_1015369 [Entomophthora muscae]